MKIFKSVLLLGFAMAAAPALAELKVFACEPEWGALVRELGGDQVEVYTATTAWQDPHRVQARPGLIAQARGSDLLVCNGAGLEAGWLPLLLRRASNAAIQPGQPGHFLAAERVALKEAPAVLDRRQGDVHAEGNPHIITDPNHVLTVANALAPVLVKLDAENAEVYLQRHASFSRRWQQAVLEWERRAQPLKGQALLVQHDSWIYLVGWLGMRQVGVLEPVAGIAPGAGHLARVLSGLKDEEVSMVVRAAYQAPRPTRWVAEQSGIPEVVLPYTVGAEGADDLFVLYETTLGRMLEALP
ncbi:MAG: zinc ABC transporter substrate-binding protein [Gammaproteobacteria bacterium]|nr:zinc ABC transporter substrate-binding protein [Gammaproteobacteria bacterium]